MKTEESTILDVKSKLAALIMQFMQEKELNQYQTATKVGTTQPRISDLTRGKISRFSIESLLLIALKLGVDIEQEFDPEYGLNIRMGAAQ